MDFVAIDFETANSDRTSACALGICIVENNLVVETKSFLIKPVPFFFHPFNVGIHGIRANDVECAPTFIELWDDISHIFENKLVVAHNAAFDISVLRHALEFYNAKCPDIDILCTYRLSQLFYPNLGSYRLDMICKKLDIGLDHHNAASDAVGCAKILCHINSDHNIQTLNDLCCQLNVSSGYVRQNNDYSPCRIMGGHKVAKTKSTHDLALLDPAYMDDDFVGKKFVFTGTLLSMSRSKALEIVALGGGTPQDNVTKSTNYLVVGLQDYRTLNGELSGKMRKAYQLKESGQDIQIIVEDEFISMIDDELYSKCGFVVS